MATRTATRLRKRSKARRPVDLHYEYILALSEFRDDPNIRGHYPDNALKGLFLHVGTRSMVWRYRLQRTVKGVRKMVFKSLGEWPGVGTDTSCCFGATPLVAKLPRRSAPTDAHSTPRARVGDSGG